VRQSVDRSRALDSCVVDHLGDGTARAHTAPVLWMGLGALVIVGFRFDDAHGARPIPSFKPSWVTGCGGARD